MVVLFLILLEPLGSIHSNEREGGRDTRREGWREREGGRESIRRMLNKGNAQVSECLK